VKLLSLLPCRTKLSKLRLGYPTWRLERFHYVKELHNFSLRRVLFFVVTRCELGGNKNAVEISLFLLTWRFRHRRLNHRLSIHLIAVASFQAAICSRYRLTRLYFGHQNDRLGVWRGRDRCVNVSTIMLDEKNSSRGR
jgi:hypothetical protein